MRRLFPLMLGLSLALLSPLTAVDEALEAAREAAEKGDHETALKLLKAEAEKGSGEAANAVAEIVLGGRAGEEDPVEAMKWFEKAVAAGDAAGHFNLALLLTTAPKGVEKDPERARFLIEAAAEKGYAPAQFEFGKILESEIDLDGPSPDFSEARAWIEKAAGQGNPQALFAMVRYCDLGLAGKVEATAATDYCILASKAGSSAAMNAMGERYQSGTGIRADNIAAVGWFLRSAQEGYPPALVNLGRCYSDGLGLRRDYDKAGEHFSAAAKLGHGPGEFLLGQLFEGGLGTAPDPVKAFVLYSRAVAHGLEEATERRDKAGAVLNAEQKKLAEKQIAIALEGVPK